MNHKLFIACAALNISLASLASEPSSAHIVETPIQMKSRDAIDQQLRNHKLFHLADNSPIARRLGSATVTAATLDQIIEEERDAYLKRFPEKDRLSIAWLSKVVRGTAFCFPDEDFKKTHMPHYSDFVSDSSERFGPNYGLSGNNN